MVANVLFTEKCISQNIDFTGAFNKRKTPQSTSKQSGPAKSENEGTFSEHKLRTISLPQKVIRSRWKRIGRSKTHREKVTRGSTLACAIQGGSI